MYDLVCIGASWGGLQAVGQVLTDLPAELDLPIAIAQHRHPDSQAKTLAELLQTKTDRPVLDVEDKMPIASRHVYIAPPNYHLLVERGSFALSVDDFVITYFNAGSETTFPLFVWGSARVAVPPQINVIGSMIFLVAIGLMLANIVIQRRRGEAPLAEVIVAEPIATAPAPVRA